MPQGLGVQVPPGAPFSRRVGSVGRELAQGENAMKGRYCMDCGKLCLPSGFQGMWQHYRGPCVSEKGVVRGDSPEMVPEGNMHVRDVGEDCPGGGIGRHARPRPS